MLAPSPHHRAKNPDPQKYQRTNTNINMRHTGQSSAPNNAAQKIMKPIQALSLAASLMAIAAGCLMRRSLVTA